MSCEVAALAFQAHANNGTWSIDFDCYRNIKNKNSNREPKIISNFG